MVRLLRIEYPGACYDVRTRGDTFAVAFAVVPGPER